MGDIRCFECNTLIGYTWYSGPTGIMYCVECGLKEQEEEETND